MGDKFFRWLKERRVGHVVVAEYNGPDRRKQEGDAMREIIRWAITLVLLPGSAWVYRTITAHETQIAVLTTMVSSIKEDVAYIRDRMDARRRP